jgi:hypothetical protein
VRLASSGLGLAGMVGLALVAAACGGSSSRGVAHVGTIPTTTSRSSSSDAAAYSACMRKNGVAKFPDPGPGGRLRLDKDKLAQDFDANSPGFKAAANACERLLPAGGSGPSSRQLAEALQLALRYARCIRAHGVPGFPDPKTNAERNGLEFDFDRAHVNQDSPRFKAAERACIALGRGAKNALGPQSGGRGSTP